MTRIGAVRAAALAALLLAGPGPAGAADGDAAMPREMPALRGESIAVQDGDSFVLRTDDGRKLRIRIAGIDAPEKGQPFADVSRRHLAGLLRGRELQLQVSKVDPFGRQVARVSDGERDVGLAQLQAGLAWFFRRYASEQAPAQRSAYADAEAAARRARLGLWRDEAPLPPWDHRRASRAR